MAGVLSCRNGSCRRRISWAARCGIPVSPPRRRGRGPSCGRGWPIPLPVHLRRRGSPDPSPSSDYPATACSRYRDPVVAPGYRGRCAVDLTTNIVPLVPATVVPFVPYRSVLAGCENVKAPCAPGTQGSAIAYPSIQLFPGEMLAGIIRPPVPKPRLVHVRDDVDTTVFPGGRGECRGACRRPRQPPCVAAGAAFGDRRVPDEAVEALVEHIDRAWFPGAHSNRE